MFSTSFLDSEIGRVFVHRKQDVCIRPVLPQVNFRNSISIALSYLNYFNSSEGLPTDSDSLFATLDQSLKIRLLELIYDLHKDLTGSSADSKT